MPIPEVVPQRPPRPEAETVAVPSTAAVKESKWVLISMAVENQMLEELRKIREAVTPKPTPPPKGFRAEFKDFLGKAGVLGLAVGFIMGLYIGKVVSALVSDIIMPIPGAFVPGGDWRKAVVIIPVGNGINFAIGDFLGVIVDFLIVAVVVFLIAKYARKMGLK
jgi:large conductance mechanosensitive channel